MTLYFSQCRVALVIYLLHSEKFASFINQYGNIFGNKFDLFCLFYLTVFQTHKI